jgi:hypothetical protein
MLHLPMQSVQSATIKICKLLLSLCHVYPWQPYVIKLVRVLLICFTKKNPDSHDVTEIALNMMLDSHDVTEIALNMMLDTNNQI